MDTYRGKIAHSGIAEGNIRLYRSSRPEIDPAGSDYAGTELARYREAQARSIDQLEELYQKALTETGEKEALLFRTYQMVLQDEALVKRTEQLIMEDHVSAAYAVQTAGSHYIKQIEDLEDAYLRGRGADLTDLVLRVVHNILGYPAADDAAEEPVILAAESLSPSELMQLNRTNLLALVISEDSVNSHTAILARSMGIPALVGVRMMPMQDEWNGRSAIVDAENGIFYIDPDEETRKQCLRIREQIDTKGRQLEKHNDPETAPAGGHRIRLYANISDVRELSAAVNNGAEGIGLYRSEFLFLSREDAAPSEEEQLSVYEALLKEMDGKTVVIRTLDIGADKRCAYMQFEDEDNPALGVRGIRYCLKHPKIFREQLRALLRASACGNAAIMYPMITDAEEIRQIRRIEASVREELDARGIACGHLRHGIMIETPAAALISDELAGYADFFSIGTNDLMQYTLAMDRQNGELQPDKRHPALRKLIQMTVDNAHRAGIPVSICGDMASDPELTEWFASLGVDALSMAPEYLPAVRAQLRNQNA